MANSTQNKHQLINKNKTTTVITNGNNTLNGGQKSKEIFGNMGGKTGLDGLLGQKFIGPKISTIKR